MRFGDLPGSPGHGHLVPGRVSAFSFLLLLWACAQRPPSPQIAGALEEVVFDRYTPLSRTEEIARRTLPPLTFRIGQQMLAAGGQAFREQPIDLTKERFAVYVPAGAAPKDGYGLLVFIAPWSEATRPQLWRSPLDRHGVIFVSAANSGNEEKVLDRRLPLALLAYENVRARYPIGHTGAKGRCGAPRPPLLCRAPQPLPPMR